MRPSANQGLDAACLRQAIVSQPYFTPALFTFLSHLRRHNSRPWFLENKADYEANVRDPLLRLIADLGAQLQTISPHFLADPRPTGGSMFRIYRDTRFSTDKSPYKTHAAAHFRHRRASRDAHTPGFYLHLEPSRSFAATGIWHPDVATLLKIREAIVDRPDDWRQVRRSGIEIEGDSLTRPPRGFDPHHEFVDDLKRKDFVTSVPLPDAAVCSPQFSARLITAFRRTGPLVEFLSRALGLPY